MNILITGGSGFIGSYFNEKLTNHDKVINFDLREPINPTEHLFVKGDLRRLDDVENVISNHKIEKIIHLAAAHHDFGIEPDEYFETNEAGTKILCEIASKYKIKDIIFYSSVAVYGDNKTPSHEEMDPIPSNDYGCSKLAAEKVLKEWVSESQERRVIVIRPCLVYGPRNVANMYNLIKQIDSGKFFNVGKGDNVKSICYVENIVEATLYVDEHINESGFHVFNYADEPQLTSKQTANHIANCLGKKDQSSFPIWLLLLAALPFDIIIKITGKNLPVSTARVKKFATETYHKAEKIRLFGFKSTYDNYQGLKKMVEWYKVVK
jgi:GlcNAc-P-P-Und epimerase